jgi:carboxypeptidase D
MRLASVTLGVCLGLSAFAEAGFNRGAINAFKKVDKHRHAQRGPPVPAAAHLNLEKRQSKFSNAQTQKFAVNGSALPDVDFDLGESYAGLLPISQSPDEERKLYFWFFPSTNADAGEEIVIWFNGGQSMLYSLEIARQSGVSKADTNHCSGPGCSSLSGLLTENGPFLFQDGTLAPVPNSYSWTNLTNAVWVEQPVGVGFSQGTPNITNEVELGQQFAGFWRNFIETFGMQGYKTYITGESYGG